MLMEALKFVFSSFWMFIGTAFLIAVTGQAIQTAFKGLRGLVKITVKRKGNP